jgi:hypothetical protein
MMPIALEPIFLSTKQIAEILKIDPRKIGYYVKKFNLPAFKESEGDTSPWKARRESLEAWAAEHEKRFLK